MEYEEYEPIVTVEAAMAEGATPLHPDLRKDNVIVHSHMTLSLIHISRESPWRYGPMSGTRLRGSSRISC